MDTLTLLSFCLSLLLIALCGRAIWFYGYAAYAALHEQIEGRPAEPTSPLAFYPRVTVIKLLQREDTAATLQSFCQQCYPHYQIVFAIEASEMAVSQIEAFGKLIQQFPDQDIQYVTYPIGTRSTGLSHALKAAKFEVWVFADCTSMAPDALQHLVQPLRYPSVGAVHGLQSQTTGWLSQWQTFALAAEWYPELLVARHQNSIYGIPSSVVAIRKAAVMQLGNLETVVCDLALGSGLGDQLAKIGYRVTPCYLRHEFDRFQGQAGTHSLSAGSVWATLQQQLNQMRLARSMHAWKYGLKGTTYSTVVSLLVLWNWHGSLWAWLIIALTGLSRLVMTGLISMGCFKDPTIWRFGLLLPFYDLVSFGLWCVSWFGTVPQQQGFLPSPSEPFERAEQAEAEFLGLLVQPAKVKGT